MECPAGGVEIECKSSFAELQPHFGQGCLGTHLLAHHVRPCQGENLHELSADKTACHAGSWWRARQEMSKLIANYDSSTAGDALLRALVACGASDVAHSLSQSRSASQVCTFFRPAVLHSTLSSEKTWHGSLCTMSHLITMRR